MLPRRIDAPAQDTTASTPPHALASEAGSRRSPRASSCAPSPRTRSGSRTSARTRYPRATSSATAARPSAPVAPATSTRSSILPRLATVTGSTQRPRKIVVEYRAAVGRAPQVGRWNSGPAAAVKWGNFLRGGTRQQIDARAVFRPEVDGLGLGGGHQGPAAVPSTPATTGNLITPH